MPCGNDFELPYKLTVNVFNDQMFHQYVSFSSNNNETMKKHKTSSKYWVLCGGFLGIFSLPLLVFGCTTNILVIYILIRYVKLNGKQHLYGITLAVLYLCQLIFSLLFLDYYGVGRVWLRSDGIYLEQNGSISCKSVHFIRQSMTAFEINLVFLESFNRFLSIQAFGRFNPTTSLTMFSIFCALLISFIVTAPTFIMNNLWKVDYRYYCSPDPVWPTEILFAYIIHRILLIEGVIQITLVAVFNILTIKELNAYKSLNYTLEKAIQETQLNTEILIEIRNFIYNYCNETHMILVHTSIASIFSIPRVTFIYKIFYENYRNYEDNTKIDGVLDFYMSYGMFYLQIILYYLFISCYIWIYFFTMQTFRQCIRKMCLNLFQNNERVASFIDMFMLGDMLREKKFTSLNSDLFDNLDAVTLQRIQHLENNEMNNRVSLIYRS